VCKAAINAHDAVVAERQEDERKGHELQHVRGEEDDDELPPAQLTMTAARA
jgi:hypothetical protein